MKVQKMLFGKIKIKITQRQKIILRTFPTPATVEEPLVIFWCVSFPTGWFLMRVIGVRWGFGAEEWAAHRGSGQVWVQLPGTAQHCWLREREFQAGLPGGSGWGLDAKLESPAVTDCWLFSRISTHISPGKRGLSCPCSSGPTQPRSKQEIKKQLQIACFTPGYFLVCFNIHCFSNLIVLQNHLGACKHRLLDPSPGDSHSGGLGGAWEGQFPPSQVMLVQIVRGPHSENHCFTCQDLRKIGTPRRYSL